MLSIGRINFNYEFLVAQPGCFTLTVLDQDAEAVITMSSAGIKNL